MKGYSFRKELRHVMIVPYPLDLKMNFKHELSLEIEIINETLPLLQLDPFHPGLQGHDPLT